MILFGISCILVEETPNLTIAQQDFLRQQQTILEQALVPKSGSKRVRAWTSSDLKSWKEVHNGLPHSFSSLGLHREEEHLVLSGQHRLQRPTRQEEEMQLLWSQLLHFDGTKWRAEIRSFTADLSAHADHQWFEGELWLQSSPPLFREGQYDSKATAGRDPLLQNVEHQIRTPDRVWLKKKGLADPAPVRFENSLRLFVTYLERNQGQVKASIRHYVQQDDQLILSSSFSGVSVPYAVVVEQELWLLAQRRSRYGPLPVWTKTKDGISWDRWSDVPIELSKNGCGSPVMGQLREKWWIFCTEAS